MKTKALLPLVLLFFAAVASAAIKTEVVEYKDGDTVLEGFLAYDDAADKKSWEDMKAFFQKF